MNKKETLEEESKITKDKFENGLFIFRRDLRIQDNIGLNKAIQECDKVFCIFIFTPEQVTSNSFKSDNAVQFMIESLDDLEETIHSVKGKLGLFYGENVSVVNKVIKKYHIDCVYFNEDISPYAKKRDRQIEKVCKSNKIPCKTSWDYYLYSQDEIKTTTNSYYTKFTPYYNSALKVKPPKPSYIKKYKISNQIQGNITLLDAYLKFGGDLNPNKLVTGGRVRALNIINNIGKFKNYNKIRDNLDDSTTLLSAYLKFGNISVREAFYKMKSALGLSSGLIRQLIWREFYANILNNFPHVLGNPMNTKYKKLNWSTNTSLFNAWKQGKTGFPIVDAGMREMNTTGYMHNRARLITASFLIKTLLIDWEKGEKYFAQKLTDYDPASNNGNWQWVASTGTDSQPYFRIMNPWSQGEKFDPDATYIKKWVPELKDVPAKKIHQLFKIEYKEDEDMQKVKYPEPIVDYSEMREKALKMYKNAS